jgi:hypothetical protein
MRVHSRHPLQISPGQPGNRTGTPLPALPCSLGGCIAVLCSLLPAHVIFLENLYSLAVFIRGGAVSQILAGQNRALDVATAAEEHSRALVEGVAPERGHHGPAAESYERQL